MWLQAGVWFFCGLILFVLIWLCFTTWLGVWCTCWLFFGLEPHYRVEDQTAGVSFVTIGLGWLIEKQGRSSVRDARRRKECCLFYFCNCVKVSDGLTSLTLEKVCCTLAVHRGVFCFFVVVIGWMLHWLWLAWSFCCIGLNCLTQWRDRTAHCVCRCKTVLLSKTKASFRKVAILKV